MFFLENTEMIQMKIAQQTRDEIVRLYSQHVPIREIMRRFEVSRSSIYNFLKFDKMHISSNGCMAITFRQITSMESELNRLRQENEILKTCGCYIEAPLAERLSCIEKLSDKYSVHILCKTLNILRSTYYHYILRSPEKTVYQISDELI